MPLTQLEPPHPVAPRCVDAAVGEFRFRIDVAPLVLTRGSSCHWTAPSDTRPVPIDG